MALGESKRSIQLAKSLDYAQCWYLAFKLWHWRSPHESDPPYCANLLFLLAMVTTMVYKARQSLKVVPNVQYTPKYEGAGMNSTQIMEPESNAVS